MNDTPSSSVTSSNTYLTSFGPVVTYPEPTPTNPYGFIIKTEPSLSTPDVRPRPRITLRFILWTIFAYPLFALEALFKWRPFSETTPHHPVIPAVLRDHLIIITPPPGTPFPLRYPFTSSVRIWFSPSAALASIATFRASGVPEILILPYPITQIGQKRIQRGDVIFVGGIGYYVTGEIGSLPSQARWMEGLVALEGHTINREKVTLFLPSRYVEPPEVSGGVIIGELTEEGEER